MRMLPVQPECYGSVFPHAVQMRHPGDFTAAPGPVCFSFLFGAVGIKRTGWPDHPDRGSRITISVMGQLIQISLQADLFFVYLFECFSGDITCGQEGHIACGNLCNQ